MGLTLSPARVSIAHLQILQGGAKAADPSTLLLWIGDGIDEGHSIKMEEVSEHTG